MIENESCKTLSAESILRTWAKDPGPRGAAASLVLMQLEDLIAENKRLRAAITKAEGK